MHISALQVAELYKNRWQVELFFKWLKQHLKIKRFWGTTENAVRIQIYAAICAYCLVAIIQHDMQLDRNQKILGNYRECCSNTDICCYMRLLFGGNHSTRYATGQKYI